MRCAIYARYSSDLQRESSIEDQTRKCRAFAEPKGWVVLPECVRSDEEITGASLTGRPALRSLIEDAKRRPRPFDRILIDDTSRLARNVADALNMVETLRFHGIGVTFVSQGIDTLDKAARQLVTINGMMDEQFLVGLASKVHRGQEGQVLKGLNPGGKCFGYRNVPIEDPNRQGKYGRPAIAGVRLEPHEEQATVVLRVFQMYADGMGLASIAKTLNADNVPAPQPPRTRAMQAWCPSSIREMLRNERYRGVQVWNRTEKARNPETGRKVSKARPSEEWRRVDVPQWRIVPESLWNTVHARIVHVGKKFGAARLGGMNRTERSRSYLFSGLLICGTCGSRIVIISGQGKRGYVRYGCPSHRYRGVCSNGLTIRQDRLEKQLLAALETRILNSQLIEYTLQRFHDELQKRLAEIQRHATGLDEFRRQRSELQVKAERLTTAIADIGHSPALLSKLAEIEVQIAQVNRREEAARPVNLAATVGEVREFVYTQVMQLRNLFRQDGTGSKATLARHIGQLILTPKQNPSGPIYEVSGDVDLMPGKSDVMLMVARDGIEPPTPAFSGLLIDKAKWFRMRLNSCLQTTSGSDPLGSFGPIWAVLGSRMFPYCFPISMTIVLCGGCYESRNLRPRQHRGPELQLREMQDYATRHQWEIVQIYQDIISGASASRPGLNQLMDDARARKLDIVLCWKLDRFGRSLLDCLANLRELDSQASDSSPQLRR